MTPDQSEARAVLTHDSHAAVTWQRRFDKAALALLWWLNEKAAENSVE